MGADWTDWIGRTTTATDAVASGMVAGLAATLDSPVDWPAEGNTPQGIHWLLAPDRAPIRELGPDGHPARGGFLPPIDLPRRMWAASEVRFIRPLAVGDEVQRISRIASVEPKEGSSGPLVFVGIDHRFSVGGRGVIEERQTLVYREVRPTVIAAGGQLGPDSPDFERRLVPNSVMLFRYSALTFNGHRIHYDYRYATKVELYPNVVVHGPLMASLLLDLSAGALGTNRLASFSFRAVSPAFVDRPMRLAATRDGNRLALVADTDDGRIVMRADATLV